MTIPFSPVSSLGISPSGLQPSPKRPTLIPQSSGINAANSGFTAPAKLSILSLPSTSSDTPEVEAPALVRLSSIRVTFMAQPVRKHVGRPLRVVLRQDTH
eukprot:RCo037678